MNICLVLFSDAWSGAENVVHELARYYLKRGNNVSIVLNHEIYRHYTDLDGVKLLDIGPLYNSRYMVKSIFHTIDKPVDDLAPDRIPFDLQIKIPLRKIIYGMNSSMIKKHLIEEKIDIVHLHLDESFQLFSNCIEPLHIPTVITLHSPFLNISQAEGYSIKRAIRRRFLTNVLNGIAGVTYQCQGDVKSMETLSPSFPYGTIMIPNGVDVGRVQENSTKAIEDEAFKLVYAGGARWQKGGILAVKTVAALVERGVNVRLYMLGRIPDDHEIRTLVRELNLDDHIVFLGFIPFPRVYNYLSSADIILIPSISEGFPVIAVEAMALGKPIVGTNIGGIPAALDNKKNAILVTPDPIELADAIQFLWSNPEKMAEMSSMNLEDAKRFDWDNIVDEYLSYFRAISNGSN